MKVERVQTPPNLLLHLFRTLDRGVFTRARIDHRNQWGNSITETSVKQSISWHWSLFLASCPKKVEAIAGCYISLSEEDISSDIKLLRRLIETELTASHGGTKYIPAPNATQEYISECEDATATLVQLCGRLIAYKYHAACGSHCSVQRQSSSLPVTAKPLLKAMPSSSSRSAVMPLTIEPGALVYL